MDRKNFLVSACTFCAMGLTATLVDSCSKSTPVNFTLNLNDSANAPLATTGGYVISNNVIVKKTASGYLALSLSCTHEGATVNYNGTSFTCPRHGATFDTNGTVTGGPATTSLAKLTVTQAGNILTIQG